MNINNYIREHPWAIGIIVVVGGIIFFVIFSGGSPSNPTNINNGPSDAAVAASAQLQAAQIAANAQISAAQVGAGIQLNSDNKQAEIAMLQIKSQSELASKFLDLQGQLANQDAATKAAAINNIGKFTGRGGYDEQKAAALQTIFSGVNAPIPIQAKSPGDSVGGILGGIGNIFGNLGGLGALFSDQRLKENIQLLGQDKRGRNVYSFNYKGSKTKRAGYIAQDLKRSEPNIVSNNNTKGYLAIDPRQAEVWGGPAQVAFFNNKAF